MTTKTWRAVVYTVGMLTLAVAGVFIVVDRSGDGHSSGNYLGVAMTVLAAAAIAVFWWQRSRDGSGKRDGNGGGER